MQGRSIDDSNLCNVFWIESLCDYRRVSPGFLLVLGLSLSIYLGGGCVGRYFPSFRRRRRRDRRDS